MRILLALSVVALLCGWFTLPYILRSFTGDCVAETTMIYDEQNRMVVTHGHWDSVRGNTQYHYSAQLKIIPDNGSSTQIDIERIIDTDHHFFYNSLDVKTVKAFRIAGPETTDPVLGKYIDPLAEEGFHARVYVYLVGSRIMPGFRMQPLGICQSQK